MQKWDYSHKRSLLSYTSFEYYRLSFGSRRSVNPNTLQKCAQGYILENTLELGRIEKFERFVYMMWGRDTIHNSITKKLLNPSPS